MQLNNWLLGVLVLGIALVVGMPGSHAQISEEKRAKICAKAENRYQSIFGKPSTSEDVAIVMMHKYTFCPLNVTVKQGTTVRWINVDKRTSHSVWFKEADKAESERLFGEESVEIKFDLPLGEYPYLCGPHWKEEGMIGTVLVIK
jgi:plastocyanin